MEMWKSFVLKSLMQVVQKVHKVHKVSSIREDSREDLALLVLSFSTFFLN